MRWPAVSGGWTAADAPAGWWWCLLLLRPSRPCGCAPAIAAASGAAAALQLAPLLRPTPPAVPRLGGPGLLRGCNAVYYIPSQRHCCQTASLSQFPGAADVLPLPCRAGPSQERLCSHTPLFQRPRCHPLVFRGGSLAWSSLCCLRLQGRAFIDAVLADKLAGLLALVEGRLPGSRLHLMVHGLEREVHRREDESYRTSIRGLGGGWRGGGGSGGGVEMGGGGDGGGVPAGVCVGGRGVGWTSSGGQAWLAALPALPRPAHPPR